MLFSNAVVGQFYRTPPAAVKIPLAPKISISTPVKTPKTPKASKAPKASMAAAVMPGRIACDPLYPERRFAAKTVHVDAMSACKGAFGGVS